MKPDWPMKRQKSPSIKKLVVVGGVTIVACLVVLKRAGYDLEDLPPQARAGAVHFPAVAATVPPGSSPDEHDARLANAQRNADAYRMALDSVNYRLARCERRAP